MIGRILNNRYKIDSEIGQGGMGTVYRGFDTTLDRQDTSRFDAAGGSWDFVVIIWLMMFKLF